MNNLYFILQQMLYFSIPLLIVALGGMFSERSGIINIALEGIMLIGAFTGVLVIHVLQLGLRPEQLDNVSKGQVIFLIGILVAGVTGAIFSLLHAYASIKMRADQTISGTALNLLAPAAAIYIARTLSITNYTQQVSFTRRQFFIRKIPILGDIPIIGNILFSQVFISTYLGLLIFIIAYFLIYKTKFGLRLRACGEHPHAADAAGINVSKMRYLGVLISGFLAGIGGIILIITTQTEFNATVSGYGFLALAVLIFGQWKPKRILFAAFFFGIMKTVASAYSSIKWLMNLQNTLNIHLPSEFYKMIPFIATLILLAYTSVQSQAPKAIGEIYDPGKR